MPMRMIHVHGAVSKVAVIKTKRQEDITSHESTPIGFLQIHSRNLPMCSTNIYCPVLKGVIHIV